MTVELTSAGVDLGIVVDDLDAALGFYRDVVGLRYDGENPVPGGGTMHRLYAGESMIKLVCPDPAPEARPVSGDPMDGLGYRYWTMSVSNIDEVYAACTASGAEVVRPPSEIVPGVHIAVVLDPAGNALEFLQMG